MSYPTLRVLLHELAGSFVASEDVPLLALHIRIIAGDATNASLSSLFAIRSAIANRLGDMARRICFRNAFLGSRHSAADSVDMDRLSSTVSAIFSPRQFRQVIIEQHLPSAVSHLRCMRAALSNVAHAARQWGIGGGAAGQTRESDVTLAVDAALAVYFALRQETLCPS